MNRRTRGLLAFGLGAGAVLWALGLVAAAFLVPTYGGDSCQGNPHGATVCDSLPSQTLFAVNGWWVVELLLAVAAVAAVAFWALHVFCVTGARLAMHGAVACICILGVFSFLSGFSIGPFVFPLVLLLIASAAVTSDPST
ncbi:MAG: hypothetical protein ACJ743_12760 [Gaiellaceae bacterium]